MTAPTDTFTWQAHPARERAGGAALGLATILAVAVAAWWSTGVIWWGVLSLAVLLFALNRFFFPSRFVIDGQGITAKYPLRSKRLAWGDLRRFSVDDNGGFLSTRARRSRLDAYRGMHILFGADRDAVVDRIQARLGGKGQPCPA
jgi:hypothetical protein